jgi:hypothetical protein
MVNHMSKRHVCGKRGVIIIMDDWQSALASMSVSISSAMASVQLCVITATDPLTDAMDVFVEAVKDCERQTYWPEVYRPKMPRPPKVLGRQCRPFNAKPVLSNFHHVRY